MARLQDLGPLDPIFDVDKSTGAIATGNTPALAQLTVTINQAPGQDDPTSDLPILFEAVFSRAATGFTTAAISGTAGATSATVTEIAPFDGTTYEVAVNSVPNDLGTVIANVLSFAATAVDNGMPNSGSTSTDNVVNWVGGYDNMLINDIGAMWYSPLREEDTSNAALPMGGDTFFDFGGFRYLRFNTTQPFWTGALGAATFDVFAVGGGGGGVRPATGSTGGGGGGAGAAILTLAQSVTDTALVTIGTGGAVANATSLRGGTGVSTTFGGLITAAGGGGGGTPEFASGSGESRAAGSGGGGSGGAGFGAGGTGGTGGNNGGTGILANNRPGGGGGAGGVGVTPVAFPGTPGNGGPGLEYPAGSGNFWAGGGAGGDANALSVGGTGGGGSWNSNATANTGGGGGSRSNGGGGLTLGAGGSGVVLVKVPIP